MDCNFRGVVDDFVVPKDQGKSDNDNFPSPHSLLNWGISAPESYGSASKRFLMDASLPQRQMNPNSEILCDEDMMDASIRGNEQSSSLSLFEGSVDDIFNQTTTSHDRQDCQLDDLVELDTMDDILLYSVPSGITPTSSFPWKLDAAIFMLYHGSYESVTETGSIAEPGSHHEERDSFLEDLPRTENPQKSFCLSRESECNSMLVDNLSKDMIVDSQSFSSDEHSIGSSKYLKTHAFSPTVVWNIEANASQFLPCTTIEASQINTSVASGQNCIDECVHKETSVEESVLRELEMVIAQLTDETRICFRDAFYRLAKNSERHIEEQRQQEDVSVETLPSLIGHAEKERSGTQEDTESETNIIDRTIASLLFGNMQMFVENSPVEETADAEQEDTRATGRPNHNLNRSQSQHFNHYPVYPSDCEVPIYGHGQVQATKADDCSDVSEIPADYKMDKVYNTGVGIYD